jgi:hypothetical protein
MLRVEQFVDEVFEPNSRDKKIAQQIVAHHNLPKRDIIQVTRDGRCFISFIRSIVQDLIIAGKEASFGILSKFVPKTFEHELSSRVTVGSISDNNTIIKLICANVMDAVYNKWDYEGQTIYTESSTNTDLVYDMIMRLLGIVEIKIYLVDPSLSLEETVKIIKPSKSFFYEPQKIWKVQMLCLKDYCHYNLLF